MALPPISPIPSRGTYSMHTANEYRILDTHTYHTIEVPQIMVALLDPLATPVTLFQRWHAALSMLIPALYEKAQAPARGSNIHMSLYYCFPSNHGHLLELYQQSMSPFCRGGNVALCHQYLRSMKKRKQLKVMHVQALGSSERRNSEQRYETMWLYVNTCAL